jgi:hypothetical protein
MPYVRDRGEPVAKEQARKRREENRRHLAPDPASPGARFDGAFEWLRIAARYAGRRSYRQLEIAEQALARRDQIRADAAKVVQSAADEIARPVPARFRPSPNRARIREASRKAATPREQLDLARAWLMHAGALAVRYASRDGGAAKARADLIKDKAAARLIEWAEEMDSDRYPE